MNKKFLFIFLCFLFTATKPEVLTERSARTRAALYSWLAVSIKNTGAESLQVITNDTWVATLKPEEVGYFNCSFIKSMQLSAKHYEAEIIQDNQK